MSNLSTDYDVRLATLKKLGGDMSKKYATIYDVDLAILDKIGQGGGGGGSTVWGDIYDDIKDQKDLIDLISQSGGSLTPEQEEAIEKLVNANEGVLITKEIKSLDYYDSYLQNVYSSKYIANEHITPGEAYFVSNQALWKFNYESISFEKITGYAEHLIDNIVWKDNSGRYYNGNSQIDIETGNQIKVVDGIVVSADVKMIIENRIGSKPIHLMYEIDDDVPQFLIGDSLRIRQILINLIEDLR